jgi:hypothetical protein
MFPPLFVLSLLQRKRDVKKSVRFVEKKNQVYPVERIDDISDEEFVQIWYTHDDYDEFKSACGETVALIEAGKKLTPEHTNRGLENKTHQGGCSKIQIKRNACNAVLDEQGRQWLAREDDTDQFARVYMKHSKRCANAAVQKAREDEMEAFMEAVGGEGKEARLAVIWFYLRRTLNTQPKGLPRPPVCGHRSRRSSCI